MFALGMMTSFVSGEVLGIGRNGHHHGMSIGNLALTAGTSALISLPLNILNSSTSSSHSYNRYDNNSMSTHSHGSMKFCRIPWKNGIYEGETKNGKPHGRGIYTGSNGDTYDGEFEKGKFEGYGTWTWKTRQATYAGYYQNGLQSGWGKQTQQGREFLLLYKDGKEISCKEIVKKEEEFNLPLIHEEVEFDLPNFLAEPEHNHSNIQIEEEDFNLPNFHDESFSIPSPRYHAPSTLPAANSAIIGDR